MSKIGRLPNGRKLSKKDLIKSYDDHFRSGQGWSNKNHPYILDLSVYSCIKDFDFAFTLLDMACGEGRTISVLKQNQYANIIGIDFSTEALKKARINNPDEEIRFIHGSIENVPMEDKSVDVVVSVGSHEHLMIPNFNEPRRLIKDNGLFLLILPACEEDSLNNGRWVQKGVQSEWWFSRKKWKKILERDGFKCYNEIPEIDGMTEKNKRWWFKCNPI